MLKETLNREVYHPCGTIVWDARVAFPMRDVRMAAGGLAGIGQETIDQYF
jgi:hypothetical protein